jgi:pullulanase
VDTKVRDGVLLHSSWNELPVYVKNDAGEIVIWDFFEGNLDGVIQKLDYLKSIGVDIIYLNPIFESSSNHKYDTADYSRIDMMYGNEDTLKRLVSEADSLGIKIMLDGVFSHTGDDSIYFNKYKNYGEDGAYNNTSSKYYSWYTFEKYPEKYDCWWGVKALPCVNELEPSYMDYLLNEKDGAVIKWMRAGIAGWRLDVADELPDEFIIKLKEAIVKVNPEAVLLGEVWEDASNKVSYGAQRKYILNNSLNSVSNYPLRDGLIALLTGKLGVNEFAASIMKIRENEEFARSLLMETEWRGGSFDVLYGNVPSNVSNGGLGFFSVSAELSDSILFGN